MALLTREQILAADDMPFEVVSVPEWGGEVRVYAFNGEEHETFQSRMAVLAKDGKGVGMNGLMRELVVLSAKGEDGQPLFTVDDMDALAKKSGAALKRIFDVSARINVFTKNDQKELAGN